MSDFKSYIKEKYNQEVQPQYTDAAWDKFTAFADVEPKKEDRKWLIFFLGSLLLITISALLYVMIGNVAESSPDPENSYMENRDVAIIADNEKGFPKTDNTIVDNLESLNNGRQLSSDIKIETQTTAISSPRKKNQSVVINDPSDNKINNTSSSIKNVITQAEIKNQDLSNIENNKTSISTNNADTQEEIEIKNPPITQPINVPNPAELKEKGMVAYPAGLMNKMYLVANQSEAIFDNRKIVPLGLENNVTKWVVGIEAGGGKLHHRSINDQESYMGSGGLMYNINNHLRIKSIIGIQKSSYSSRVLNRNLGLRSINYPVREARFDKVLSSTIYAEAGIGIDYISPEYKGLNIFLGPSIVYLKELSRNLDYNFDQGDNDFESINIKTSDHRSHPVNMMLNLGMRYQISRDFHLSLKGEYLKGLNESEFQLPEQFRLKFGIEKKL